MGMRVGLVLNNVVRIAVLLLFSIQRVIGMAFGTVDRKRVVGDIFRLSVRREEEER